MELSALFLSRLQFAATIAFHYLFPPLTIGLGLLIVIYEGIYLRTKLKVYETLTKFWVKIFAITFGMGVATGIVMEFQFGTNWSAYSRYVGDIFGSALAAEGIFAFFLESGFLAVLVFGWDKVSPTMHFVSACLVSFGSILSAVWIIVANSWQQTPAAFRIVTETVNGIERTRAEITDFWGLVFNPSSMVRLVHVLLAAFLLAGFVVMSISAYYILKKKHLDFAKRGFVIALFMAAISALLLPIVGHKHAVVVAEYQPAKLAAFEGLWETQTNAPLYLWGFPDEKNETVRGGIAVPGLLSWLVHFDAKKEVTGLDAFAKEDRPPVAVTFYSYHLMVIFGMYFIGLTLLMLLYLWRGTLFDAKWLLKITMWSVLLPYAANQLGWMAAEVGRQPWAVYGLLRTADSPSPAVAMGDVLASLILFLILYAALLMVYVYVLDRRIKAGPGIFEESEPPPHAMDKIPGDMESGKTAAEGE